MKHVFIALVLVHLGGMFLSMSVKKNKAFGGFCLGINFYGFLFNFLQLLI